MAKTTLFNNRFWQDAYIINLEAPEKLIFAYCFTGSFVSSCGIYEIAIKSIAHETGLEKEVVRNALARFERDQKIVYQDGWLGVLAYPKYQTYNLPGVIKGLEKDLLAVPKDILASCVEAGYLHQLLPKSLAIDWQLIGNRVRVQDTDTDKEDRGLGEGSKKITGEIADLFRSFRFINASWETWWENAKEIKAARNLLKVRSKSDLEKVFLVLKDTNRLQYMPKITCPSDLEEKWEKWFIQLEQYWKEMKSPPKARQKASRGLEL